MIFRNKKTTEKKYKFKALKVYASEEWLADGQKKYRRVFENLETNYLYAELSFHNKLFDESDWEAQIKFLCYRLTETASELICDLSTSQKVSKDKDIIYVREGWGHEEAGYFWKRGDYQWDVYIDNEMVGSTRFYIEEGGPVSPSFNPYFDIVSIRLYEGANEGVSLQDRKYLKQFNAEDTRYVWVEMILDNLQDRSWFCELMFNFHNDSGQLKGRTSELRQIKGTDEEFTIITGWGSDNQGTWFNDNYRLEVLFMDQLLAVVPFDCGEGTIEGSNQMILGEDTVLKPVEDFFEVEEEESIEDLMKQLNELIGLDDIKKKISEYISYLEFLQLRKDKGFKESDQMNLHSVFKGAPGTGKTTVAKLLAKIYHRMGLLSRGNIMEVGRAELIGQYIGQTAPKVKDVIEAARGGVLFIDEAYSLVRNEDDDKDYGHEVIEVLVKEMSDGLGDLAIFVAGYAKGMNTFLSSNPGFKSRFKLNFDFPDYLPQELIQISDLISRKKEIKLKSETKDYLKYKLTELYRERDHSFGNARLVISLMDEAKMAMGLRVMAGETAQLQKEDLQWVEKMDLEKIFEKRIKRLPNIGVDSQFLSESVNELNTLIGLQKVKDEIHELIRLVQYYTDSGKDILGKFSLHTAFKGNPGTGKTTVARILAKIYKALGILERGHLVEVSRQSLVAGFVGQTALKTKEMIEKAKGGVLFIDEAYSLNGINGTNDFGKEAIEVVLKEMEDQRGDFIVIVAGYTKEMNQFLEMNPGLKSRFDRELIFEDFQKDELYEVARNMFKSELLVPTNEAENHLKSYFDFLYQNRNQFFGNARTIRKIVDKTIKNQHLRMADLNEKEREGKVMHEVSLPDVLEFNRNNEELGTNKRIGF